MIAPSAGMGFGQAETLKVAGQMAANYLLETFEPVMEKSSWRPTGRQLFIWVSRRTLCIARW